MEDITEVIAIQCCVKAQSMSNNQEKLENMAKSTNASKRENFPTCEYLPTCENASQGMVSSLINWWNSGSGESTTGKGGRADIWHNTLETQEGSTNTRLPKEMHKEVLGAEEAQINRSLPAEMLEKVFRHLHPKDLKSAVLVCKW